MGITPNEVFYGGRVKEDMFNVGDGATMCLASDRYAGTIVGKSASGKTLLWQQDHAIRIDNNGMSEMQEYRYERVPTISVRKFTLRKNGRYVEKGGSPNSAFLIPGRYEYYDFSY